jgi:hypothetical protein
VDSQRARALSTGRPVNGEQVTGETTRWAQYTCCSHYWCLYQQLTLIANNWVTRHIAHIHAKSWRGKAHSHTTHLQTFVSALFSLSVSSMLLGRGCLLYQKILKAKKSRTEAANFISWVVSSSETTCVYLLQSSRGKAKRERRKGPKNIAAESVENQNISLCRAERVRLGVSVRSI